MQLHGFISLISGMALISLGAAKEISGKAVILVNNVNTGKQIGCLNGSGRWVNDVKNNCHRFTALPGRKSDSSIIYSEVDSYPCGFALSDRSDPKSQDLFECSTTLDKTDLSTWSLKSNVLSTDPEGRQFTAFGTPTSPRSEVAFGFNVIGTVAITLSWVNV